MKKKTEKKKLAKKLVLSKETLRNLEPGKLQEAVGGIASRTVCNSLDNTVC
jgi:DNA-binding XRE family transcriptional regulator